MAPAAVVFDMDGQHLFTFGGVGKDDGQLFGPQGLAFDKEGRLFVADMFNARIQVFDADGVFLYKFGERGSQPTQFENPRAVAFDSNGNLYVTEGRRSTLSVFDDKGGLNLVVGSGATSNELGFAGPKGLAIDATDRIFVVDEIVTVRPCMPGRPARGTWSTSKTMCS